ncbi:MAG TPA: protein kinase [Polyangiaceae bacterium]|nr:protein kinase [Polyangiaceae bacterium]
MSCLDDEGFVAFLSGAIPRERLGAIEEHLDACSCCRLLLAAVVADTGLTRSNQKVLSAFHAGEIIANRYEVLGLLGSGGMGEVYEVMDTLLGEKVALKSVAVSMPLDDAGLRRLKAEVQLARRVTHLNVCRVFDAGLHALPGDGGRQPANIPFFTMELLSGETLRSFMARTGPLPVERTIELVEQLAAGIDAAHSARVVHADLKSDNVMLVVEGSDTRVVVTDFGLAKNLGGSARRGRGSGSSFAGTVGYLAPERLRGGAASRAADIYALGVIVFELLTGRLPFAPELPMSKALQAREAELAELVARELPARVAAAVSRSLATDPLDRFATASELVAAMRVARSSSGRRVRRLLSAMVAVAATVGPFALVRGAANTALPVADRARVASGPSAPDVAASSAPLAVASPPKASATPTLNATVGAQTRLRASPAKARHPSAAIPPVRSPLSAPPAANLQSPAALGDDDLVNPFTARATRAASAD